MGIKIRALIGVAALGAASIAGAMPASANGDVYSKAVTPGHTDAGASTKAHVVFTGSMKLTYDKFTVNDVCPGDGYRAMGQAVIKYTDGTYYYGPHHYDNGDCHSDPWVADLPFNGSKKVLWAGVRACVDLGSTFSCASANYVYNTYS
jgi:hypothetical protein